MLIGGLPGEIVAKESRLPRSGLVQCSLSYVMLGSGESAGRGHVFSRKARTFTPRFRERTVTFYQTGSRGRGVIGISKRTDALADGSRGGRVSLRGTVVSRVVV